MRLWLPDPEYAEAFRAYRNYVIDIASEIGGRYGWGTSLVEGVMDGVDRYVSDLGIQRRPLSEDEAAGLEAALRKSWGDLRRLRREVDDDAFDEESNAWLPVQAYYAVYKAVLAFAVASGQQAPRDHRKALNVIAKDVERGLLPYPWSLCCIGCPQTGSYQVIGAETAESVHVLSNPDPVNSRDRTAMFLRTTRQKELERRFAAERQKGVVRGRRRRNLSREAKNEIAKRLAPTTVFDLFWRLRVKANYEDADTFVLGASGLPDARAFADSLAILADASVAALEALIIRYVGDDLYQTFITSYQDRLMSDDRSPVAVRASMFLPSRTAVGDAPF